MTLDINTWPHAGDDPTSEYSQLRDRIKNALNVYRPGLGGEAGRMPGVSVRALVNEITGAGISNGPQIPTMRSMAEALEKFIKP